ncbi:recombinase family protein [Stenotrophomonas sp. SY1]|uniref:recombinase family protein n=1 Tax=Stenotrophomonas sp. SY1 TaxID=477235 RepID=UPI0022B4C1A6|nr:recombinase family protein [Stenotrophomonas sp. SY1]
MADRRLGPLQIGGEPLIPAARYVRMSTDHQRYSTENQREAIEKYAAQHGFDIVRTYADEGKSGLSLDGRDALKQLIQDVQTSNLEFKAILVYDISRWGRFQDADESAYYEYVCRRAGLQVVYCAEPFENDGSPMSVIMKSVKRAMAGEYSRELSNKVFKGQCRLIELGFRQGGSPGFGLRRMLLDESRVPKAQLQPGERKSLQTDRVILAPGPADEVAVVQEIYEQFVHRRTTEREIADNLNAMGIRTDLGRRWTRGTVHQLLTNEKYVGNNVYNRTSFKLKQRHVKNSPNAWVRSNGAFEGIVPTDLFGAAQQLIEARSRRFDEATMLDLLKRLYDRTGALSGLLIDEQEGMPSSSVYRSHFGGLVRAYSLIGFRPDRDFRYLEVNQRLRSILPSILTEIIEGLMAAGGQSNIATSGLVTVNDEFTVSIVLARCRQLPSGSFRWHLRFDTSLRPDVTVVARMAATNTTIFDYYIFPRLDMPLHGHRLSEDNNEVSLDSYRFESLAPLYELAERFHMSIAA